MRNPVRKETRVMIEAQNTEVEYAQIRISRRHMDVLCSPPVWQQTVNKYPRLRHCVNTLS